MRTKLQLNLVEEEEEITLEIVLRIEFNLTQTKTRIECRLMLQLITNPPVRRVQLEILGEFRTSMQQEGMGSEEDE
jgi:hypothetical protein